MANKNIKNINNFKNNNLSNMNIKKLIGNNNINNMNNINNLSKPTDNTLGNDKNVSSDSSIIFSNYFLVVSVVITIILTLLIYFLSKSYRIGRTVDTMALYQSYQTINSFPFNAGGNIRLGDCRIASAYNCILSNYQMIDYTSSDILLAMIRSGARYLEFNIFNSEYGDKAVPVVSNGYKQGEWKMTLNDTLLEECFYILTNNAFSVMDSNTGVPNPDDPLFIGLNLNTNSNLACLNRLGKLIIDYFGERLIDSKYSFQSSDDIPEIQMKKLSGKIIFFSSDGYQGSKMEEVINYCWDNINKNPKHTLQRIYYNDVLNGKISFDDLQDFNKTGMTIIVPHIEGDLLTINYNPIPFLDVGCQFVSMNYQYIDKNIDPYITLFKDYSIILKPLELRKSNINISGKSIIKRGVTTSNNVITVKSISSNTTLQDIDTLITRPMTTTMPLTTTYTSNIISKPTNIVSRKLNDTTPSNTSPTNTSNTTATNTTPTNISL